MGPAAYLVMLGGGNGHAVGTRDTVRYLHGGVQVLLLLSLTPALDTNLAIIRGATAKYITVRTSCAALQDLKSSMKKNETSALSVVAQQPAQLHRTLGNLVHLARS